MSRWFWLRWLIAEHSLPGSRLTRARTSLAHALHAAMDRAILACYGWQALDPGHGFRKDDRGQTRYTISPTARRDLLRRLLALNLEIAAREAG
jgi:hypothetical protein